MYSPGDDVDVDVDVDAAADDDDNVDVFDVAVVVLLFAAALVVLLYVIYLLPWLLLRFLRCLLSFPQLRVVGFPFPFDFHKLVCCC